MYTAPIMIILVDNYIKIITGLVGNLIFQTDGHYSRRIYELLFLFANISANINTERVYLMIR